MQRRDATTTATNNIENSKHACAKVVDQVSQTWETLMDDEKSQKIASDLNVLEENIAQKRNEIKKLALQQKKVKTAEMCSLQQQTTMLRTQKQHIE